MKSAKSLKSLAIENPRRIGELENLQSVKHHLLRSDGTEQAFAADAIVKLANADPHATQEIRPTLEQIDDGDHQRPVRERVGRSLTLIDSQIDTSGSQPTGQIGGNTQSSDEETQIYQPQQEPADPNFCSVCGTELPDTGPANFCPGCGTDVMGQ